MSSLGWKIVVLAALLCGALLLHWRWTGIAGQDITTATVSGIETRKELGPGTRRKSVTTTAVAGFTDRNGKQRWMRWTTLPGLHAAGERLRIMHAPGNPADNAPLSAGTRFGWPLLLTGCGLLGLWVWLGGGLGNWLLRRLYPDARGRRGPAVIR